MPEAYSVPGAQILGYDRRLAQKNILIIVIIRRHVSKQCYSAKPCRIRRSP
jgi:hypothetical protein